MLWDSHACLIVHPGEDFTRISQFADWGYHFVSVNVGMDMIPNSQIMATIQSFRRQIDEHADKYVLAKTVADVDSAKKTGKLAVAFDLEGGVCLEENPAKVQEFADLGVRQIHLAYNADNSLAGGCHGDNIGLTALGRKIVDAVHNARMFMDVSHTGYKSSLDIMEHSMETGGGPVIFSHANPMGETKHPRTIDRKQARTCAQTGGMIGITGHAAFLEDNQGRSETVANQLDTLVEWVGIDRVGLAWDYMFDNPHDLLQLPADLDKYKYWPPNNPHGSNGYMATHADPENAPPRRHASPEQTDEVMQILENRGYSTADTDKIKGLNFYNMAKQVWG